MANIFYSTTHQRTALPRSKRLRQLGTAAGTVTVSAAGDGRIVALQSLITANTAAIETNKTAITANAETITANAETIAANTKAITANAEAITANSKAITVNTKAIADNKSAIDLIKETLADWFTLEGTVLHTRYALASDDTVSSLGVGADGEGTGSGGGYSRLDDWDNYAPAAGDVLSATLGYDLLQRIENIQFPETDLSGYYTAAKTDNLLTGKQDVITDLDAIRSGAALGATALQSFTESDPVFMASAAYGITNALITNWNTAYGWGDHASAGYASAKSVSNLGDAFDTYKATTNADLSTLKGTVADHSSQITTINSTLTGHGNRITALETLTGKHSTAITANSKSIADNKSAIDLIKETLADWFTLEGTVLHTRYALASDDTVSSLGVGADGEGTGSGGTVDWGAVPTSIIPAADAAYTLGTSDASWKTIYVSQEIYAGSVPLVSTLSSMQSTLGTATGNIQGLLGATAAIQRSYVTLDTQQTITGTKYFDAAYFNNIPFVDMGSQSVKLATLNDVPSFTPFLDSGTEIARIDIGGQQIFLYPKSVIRKNFLSFSNDRH